MHPDIETLQSFYDSHLGETCRQLIGRVIEAQWRNSAGLAVAALGYGTPYIDSFRANALRCFALMPAEQGVSVWPDESRCATALVDSLMIPLPDGSVDRLLLAHALESASRPEALLEEVWRILTPQGRLLAIVPSRRGMWARSENSPFGQGLPYSKTQLKDLLGRTLFTPSFWGEALYAPPVSKSVVIRAAPTLEKAGAALGLPFAGVHIVEATKQVKRIVTATAIKSAVRAPLRPVLADAAVRFGAQGPECPLSSLPPYRATSSPKLRGD